MKIGTVLHKNQVKIQRRHYRKVPWRGREWIPRRVRREWVASFEWKFDVP